MKVVNIWTTTDCNLDCTYCYEDSHLKNCGNFNQLLEDKLFCFLKENQFEYINFHGGEPLLNYQFLIEVTKKVYELNPKIKVGFTTNGTIMNAEILDFIRKFSSNFYNTVSVSIDGDKASFDICRYKKLGISVYDQVIKNALILNEVVKVRIRMTIIPDQICNLTSNILKLYKLGFKTIIPIFEIYQYKWKKQNFIDLYEQYKIMFELTHKYSDLTVGLVSDVINLFHVKGRCTLGTNIYANGDIYACPAIMGEEKFKTGNIEYGINYEKIEDLKNICNKENKLCSKCILNKSCIYERCKFYNWRLEW